MKKGFDHGFNRRRQWRDHAGNNGPVDILGLNPGFPCERREDDTVFVSRFRVVRGQSPGTSQGLPIEHTEDDLGVADVNCLEHGKFFLYPSP